MTQPILRQPAVVRLLVIALLAELGYAALNMSTMPVYLRESRGFGEAAVGIVLGEFLATEALAKLFTGRLADRYGTHLLITWGPWLSVVSIVLTVAAPRGNGAAWETVMLGSLRILDGIGAAMIWPALFSAMAATTSEKDRTAGLSALNACYLVGIALAFPLAGFANEIFRSPAAGLYFALFIFILAAVVGSYATDAVKPVSPLNTPKLQARFSLLAIGFFAYAGIGFPTFTAKLFPMDEFRLTEGQVGLIVLPTAAILAVLAGTAGRVAARFGNRRTTVGGLAIAVFGTGIMGFGAFLPELRNLLTLAIAAPLIGIGFLISLPAWYGYVGEDGHSTTRISGVMAAQGLGAIAAAPIGAGIYEKLQPFGIAHGWGASFAHWLPFFAASVCLAIAAILVHFTD